MHDVVIRGGTLIDGILPPAVVSDLAVEGNRIASAGGKAGPGRQAVAADGKLVAPGWGDFHTVSDGQAICGHVLAPSPWHGVATGRMGQCGVGFAPVRRQDRRSFIDLMEEAEDIPGMALAEGLQSDRESDPASLDALERLPRAIDDLPAGGRCLVRATS